MSRIFFTSGGDVIAGNLFVGDSQTGLAFLLIQGWTGRQNIAAAQALAELGFTSMTYDMRGHGESEGELAMLSRANFIQDSVAAYDFLKQRMSGTEIGVIGSSFGSYTAVMLSERRPVRCLSLRVPATYPDEGYEQPQLEQNRGLAEWRRESLGYLQNRALKALHDFKGPVQIIEAGEDEIIPHQAVQNYVNAVEREAPLDYRIMNGAPHRLANSKLSNEYVQLLTEWASRLH